jgi:hypothetical protein
MDAAERSRRYAPLLCSLLALLPLLFAGTTLGGCVTVSRRHRVPAPETPCSVDAGLVGSWKGQHSTQLGPGSFRLRFECDCTYSWSARFPWLRFRDEGYYRIRDGSLVFTHEGDTLTWPYRLISDSLELRQTPTETEVYGQTERTSCGPPG